VGSHTHAPPEHRWPPTHVAPLPQTHAPATEHPSDRPSAVQSTQLAPLLPQLPVARDVHTLPAQQPLAHDVASHTHAPEAQRWPDAHGDPVPHAHAPLAQRSERASHAMQAVPPDPHVLTDDAEHVLPLQHPLAQLVALQLVHAPPTHESPALHVAQAAPPAPHAARLLPGVQVSPLQQPAHELASHTHAPDAQCWPVPHAAPDPQVQLPLASQVSLVRASHAWHAPPPVPHAVALIAVHVVPMQHPLAHEVASHTHAPDTQRWPTAHAFPAPHAHAPFAAQ